MTASHQTVAQIAEILVDELGRRSALLLVVRIHLEVRGNASYEQTITMLHQALREEDS